MDDKKIKYWEQRKAQRMFEYMQSAEECAEEIQRIYWKATGYINHNLDEIYKRFKTKHHLDDLEAKRLLNKMNGASISELLNLLNQESSIDKRKELIKMIESPAYAARLQRLQELQKEVDNVMKKVYKLENERTTRFYVDLANETYYKSIYDIQKGTGLAFSFSKIPSKKIDMLLKSKWSGTNYSTRIWNNTQKLADNLKKELLINLLTGRTDREVAKIIQNKFHSSSLEARRLIRTESNYIANEMEAMSYDECDIDKYMFVATLDIRTSQICEEHDHKIYNLKDRQQGKNFPPMHPWCRSTTIAYFNDDVLEGMKRRARDPETGKTYEVSSGMTYSKWFDKYIKNNEQKLNAIKAFKNKLTDLEQYNHYKKVYRDDDTFNSFEKFQYMKYNDNAKWEQYKDALKDTEINNFISDSGYTILENISDNEILVKPIHEIKITGMSQHAVDNVTHKSDRKAMTQEKAQELVDNAKIVVFRKSNRTFKHIATDGYSVINNKQEVVTAVPQKWRKKYDKYIEKEEK